MVKKHFYPCTRYVLPSFAVSLMSVLTVNLNAYRVHVCTLPFGVFVQLYGQLRGLAGAQDLGLTPDQTPAEAFSVGQCVRATVIRADEQRNGSTKIKLSLAPGGGVATGGGDENGAGGERADVNAPPPGTVIEEAKVKRVDETTGNVQVTLPGGVPGVVTAAQMSDHPLTVGGGERCKPKEPV